MASSISRTSANQKLSFRNKLALFISIISFIFFFPGIYLSMITVSTSGSISAKLSPTEHSATDSPSANSPAAPRMALKIFDTTRSILKTVHDLWKRDYFFVATMIFSFSVLVPVSKGILLTTLFFSKKPARRKNVFTFIKSIGKWSMCDVYIVAIFLAYLSTGASKTENVKNIMMMGHSVNVDVLAGMHAQLDIGFWCFLAYCLLSLIALQLYENY